MTLCLSVPDLTLPLAALSSNSYSYNVSHLGSFRLILNHEKCQGQTKQENLPSKPQTLPTPKSFPYPACCQPHPDSTASAPAPPPPFPLSSHPPPYHRPPCTPSYGSSPRPPRRGPPWQACPPCRRWQRRCWRTCRSCQSCRHAWKPP